LLHILTYLIVTIIALFLLSHIATASQIEKRYKFPQKISIEQMVDLAYENREDLQAFDYLIKANRYAEKASIGGYLPQIFLSAHSGASSKAEVTQIDTSMEIDLPKEIKQLFPNIKPLQFELPNPESAAAAFVFPRERITMDVSQLVFSMDGPMMQRKIAQQDTYISKTQKHQLENLIRFNTESAYLELKKLILKSLFIKSLKTSSEITFDKNRLRENVGFLNISQWEGAQALFSQEQTDVINYPNDIQQSISRLERETNLPVDLSNISTSLEDIDNIQLKSLAFYQQKALDNRPDLEEQYYRIKQAGYYERNLKYKYVPEIKFFSNVTKSKFTQCGDNLTFWNLGLRVDWVLDGFTNVNLSSKFEQHKTEFILRKRDLELQIVKDVRKIYFLLKSLLNQLKPAESRYKQSVTQLGNKEQQYQIGLAPLFEYDQAKLNTRNNEFSLASLKISIRNNYQRLLFLCGYPIINK